MLKLSCCSIHMYLLRCKAVQPAIVRVGAFLNNLSRFSLVHIWQLWLVLILVLELLGYWFL